MSGRLCALTRNAVRVSVENVQKGIHKEQTNAEIVESVRHKRSVCDSSLKPGK